MNIVPKAYRLIEIKISLAWFEIYFMNDNHDHTTSLDL